MKLRTLLIASAAAIVSAVLAAQAQVPGVNSTLSSVFTLAYDNSTMKQTYSATSPTFSAPNNGGDICALYGSATKTVKVRRVLFSAVGSAAATDPVSVMRRTTVGNGGTVNSTPMTLTAYDSSNTASTVITDIYTTVPTNTSPISVGAIQDVQISVAGATTAIVAPSPTQIFTFGQLGQPIVLRGTSQSVVVNDSGLAALTVACTFEWTEE